MKSRAFDKAKVEHELSVQQRRSAIKANKSALSNVIHEIAQNHQLALNDKKVARETRPHEAQRELHAKARDTLKQTEKYCRERKASATSPGDAREDCRIKRRMATANSRKLHAAALDLGAQHAAKTTRAALDREHSHAEKLESLLDVLASTQETKRLLRDRQKPRTKEAARKGRRGAEKRSENRQTNIANFPPEHRQFCTENYRSVMDRVRGKRVEPHEACAELAQESEFGSDVEYLAATRHYEGKGFDANLARDLIFSLGGKAKAPKKQRQKASKKLIDPTKATSAARRTKPMFVDDYNDAGLY